MLSIECWHKVQFAASSECTYRAAMSTSDQCAASCNTEKMKSDQNGWVKWSFEASFLRRTQ